MYFGEIVIIFGFELTFIHNKMAVAPTMQIETVLIIRPLKVTAFVCGLVATILLMVCIACTAWLQTENTRQGLWSKCVNVQRMYEDVLRDEIDCQDTEQQDWLLACAALCIIGAILCLIATVFNAIGLANKSVLWKFKYYRVAMYLMFLSAINLIIALIVFPVMFLEEREQRINTKWYFGWGYGVAWGATIFILGAAILLLVDKESEEIFYREKTCYQHQEDEEEEA